MGNVGGIMIRLSDRLGAIASLVPSGSRLADIGSDHALLPVFLVQQGTVTTAVAGELNAGPLHAAQQQVAMGGLTGRITVRQGDGLDVIDRAEVDVITIAGMGGSVMTGILSRGKNKLGGTVQRLILQPNVAEDQVRRWLAMNGWFLVDERIVKEDGCYYVILAAIRSEDGSDTLFMDRRLCTDVTLTRERLFDMGPYLTVDPSHVFFEKWENELLKKTMISEQMAHSSKALAKREALLREIDEIREVLQCLRMVKR